MKTPEVFLHKVGGFLVERCRGLGFIPLVTRLPPVNKVFDVQPSEKAVFVKLFGHFNSSINSVSAKFGVLDPMNLTELGSLDDRNLCLTYMERYLLIAAVLKKETKVSSDMVDLCYTLDDIYKVWTGL